MSNCHLCCSTSASICSGRYSFSVQTFPNSSEPGNTEAITCSLMTGGKQFSVNCLQRLLQEIQQQENLHYTPIRHFNTPLTNIMQFYLQKPTSQRIICWEKADPETKAPQTVLQNKYLQFGHSGQYRLLFYSTHNFHDSTKTINERA